MFVAKLFKTDCPSGGAVLALLPSPRKMAGPPSSSATLTNVMPYSPTFLRMRSLAFGACSSRRTSPALTAPSFNLLRQSAFYRCALHQDVYGLGDYSYSRTCVLNHRRLRIFAHATQGLSSLSLPPLTRSRWSCFPYCAPTQPQSNPVLIQHAA